MNNRLKLLIEAFRSVKMAKLLYYAKFGKLYSDETYLRRVFPLHLGYELDLENPKTFNEKLQWLKLYDRKPDYVNMVDKVEAKKYVTSIIGEDYVVPTYAIYEKVSEIDLDALPDKFVLKTTHAGGSVGVVICRDKNHFDKENAIMNLRAALKRDHSILGREWVYSKIKHRIIAEEYLDPFPDTDLRDYKFFCFNGKVKCFKIDFGRFKEHRANYFDRDGNLISLGEITCPPDVSYHLEIPTNIKSMISIAEKLAGSHVFCRIDLYNIKERILFGEITLFPASGFGRFTDDIWDIQLGSWLDLPKAPNK